MSGALLIFVACGKSNINDQDTSFTLNAPESVYISDKVTLDLESISAENAKFKQINRMGASAADFLKEVQKEDLILPAGSRLLAVVDNNCEANQEVSRSVTQAANSQNHLRRQAASISLSREMKLSELSHLAEQDPCVIEISNDGVVRASVVSNDTLANRQLHLPSIRSAEANDILLAAGALTQEVVIAVIDTGVQLNHPDLLANLWKDAEGVSGINVVNNNATANDDNGHGTHCAGLAAAVTNNNAGVAGVLATKAKIMPVKALNAEGAGSIANIINGINYAIENKADVISMSLGSDIPSAALRRAILDATAAGITVFAAAGNSAANIGVNAEYPAAYAKDIEGFMAVAAIDSVTKTLSDFSNYNSNFVEIAAPGSNGVLSTYLNGYAFLDGTSMATPLVAGAALATVSWLKSRGLTVKAADIEAIMKTGAETNAALAPFVQGSRSLNMLSLANLLKAKYSPLTSNPTSTPRARRGGDENQCRVGLSFFCRGG